MCAFKEVSLCESRYHYVQYPQRFGTVKQFLAMSRLNGSGNEERALNAQALLLGIDARNSSTEPSSRTRP